MSATWLADVLRAAGCAVDETKVPDWKSRGHTDGPFAPVGVLGHHTAGPATGDLPSLATVRDGRPDLAGPLANLMLSRSGMWVPIAAGRGWHAGAPDNAAHWPWVPQGDGNGYLIGIEAESSGTGDWTAAQQAAYPHGVAALLAHMGAGPDRFIGHLEWAPSRKIDPAGWPGGMGGFRAAITQGDDMPLTDADVDKILNKPIFFRYRSDTDPRGYGETSATVGEILRDSYTQMYWGNADNQSWGPGVALQLKALVVKAGAQSGQSVAVAAADIKAALLDPQVQAALAKAVNDDAARRLAS